MENILCWLGGALLAYLVLRALRGMWTTVGCLALVTLSGVTAHANSIITFHNTYSAELSFQTDYYSGGSWINYSLMNGTLAVGAQTTKNDGGGLGDGMTMRTRWSLSGSPYTNIYTNSWSSGSTQTLTPSAPAPEPTWFTNSLSIKNTNWFDATYNVSVYSTNGVLMTNWSFKPDLGVQYDINFSYTNDFVATVSSPGDQSTDFERKTTIASGENAGTGASNPSNNNATASNFDPFTQLPQNTPNTTNQMVADRQNALGIAETINRGLQQLGNQFQSLGTIGGVGGAQFLGQISTNTATGTNQMSDLGAIKTNTLNTANNTAASTNLLNDIKTNLLEGGALAAASNAILGAIDAGMNTASNIYNGTGGHGKRLSDLAGEVGDSVTNNGWATAPGSASGTGPLDFSVSNGEVTYKYSLNPFSTFIQGQSGMSNLYTTLDNMTSAMGWIKSYFVAIIFFIMWWWIYQDIQVAIEKAALPAGLIKSPDADWKSVLGSLTVGLLFQTLITSLIMTLPTTMAAYYDNWGIADAHKMPGTAIGTSLAAGNAGGWSGTMLAAYKILSNMIPFTTFFVAAGNYLAFLLLKDKALNWIFIALRIRGAFSRALAWGLFTLATATVAEAAEVTVQNWTTNTLALTNELVFSFPPGAHTLDLAPGGWTNEMGTFVLSGDENLRYVLTIAHSDVTGTNEFVLSTARTPLNAALHGFLWGFGVFGTAWCVSLVRRGLRVSYGHTE